MDQEPQLPLNAVPGPQCRAARAGRLLAPPAGCAYGAAGLACAAGGGGLVLVLLQPHAGRPRPPKSSRTTPPGPTLGTLAGARLGPRGPALPQAGPERAVQALPQRVPAGPRRPQPLPQPRQQGRHALHPGLRQSLDAAARPDREEAPVPFPAGQHGLLLRHHRLRVPLPELPELEHLAAEAGGAEGPPRQPRAAAARTSCTWPTPTTSTA